MTEETTLKLTDAVRSMIDEGVTYADAIEILKRQYVVTALRLTRGIVTAAAKKIGIHRNTMIYLKRLIPAYELPVPPKPFEMWRERAKLRKEAA